MTPQAIADTIRLSVVRLALLTEPAGIAARYAADAMDSVARDMAMPPRKVLNFVRDLLAIAEQSDLPPDEVEQLRSAYSEACRHFGVPVPPEGEGSRHEPK